MRMAVVGLPHAEGLLPALLADNLRASRPAGGALGRGARRSRSTGRAGRAGPTSPAQVHARALDDPRGAHAGSPRAAAAARAGRARRAPRGPRPGSGRSRHGATSQDRLGAPVAEIPTIPPSVPGMRLQRALIGRAARGGRRPGAGPVGGRRRGHGRPRRARVRVHRRGAHPGAPGGRRGAGHRRASPSGGIELDSRGALRESVAGLPVAGPAAGEPALSPRYLDRPAACCARGSWSTSGCARSTRAAPGVGQPARGRRCIVAGRGAMAREVRRGHRHRGCGARGVLRSWRRA